MVLYSGRGAWPARRAIWVLVALLSMEAVAERGRYVTKTLSIPNFTKEFSVLATAKSGSEVVTIAVPIKPCADCSDGNNALFISPVVLEDAASSTAARPTQADATTEVIAASFSTASSVISSETSSPTASVCEADSNHDPPWMNKEHLEEEARKFCNEKDGKPVWSHGSGMGDDAVRTGGIPNKHEDKSEIIMSAEVSTAHECVAYRGNPLKNETCVAGMMTAINDCDPRDDNTRGGTAKDGCMLYKISAREVPEPKFATCDREAQVLFHDKVFIHGSGWGLDDDGNVLKELKDVFKKCGSMGSYGIKIGDDIHENDRRHRDTSDSDNRGEVYYPEWRVYFTLNWVAGSNCVGQGIEEIGGMPIKCEARTLSQKSEEEKLPAEE